MRIAIFNSLYYPDIKGGAEVALLKKPLQNDKINILTIIAMVLLPFDSVPGLFPSVYRPVSLLFLLPALLLIVFNTIYRRKLDPAVTVGVLVLVVLGTISFLITRQAHLGLDGFLDFMVTFIAGISVFAVFRYTFAKVRSGMEDNDRYVQTIFRYLAIGYLIMVVVGCINVLSLYTPVFPVGLKEQLDMIFAGKSFGRIQMTAGEPAWAARQALFGLPVLLVVKGRSSPWTIMLFLLILLTFSLEGLVILFISFFVYLVYRNWDRKLMLVFNLMKITAGIVVVVAVVYVIGKGLFEEQNQYFYSRMERFSELRIEKLSFSDLMYVDESVFIRVSYPMIGLFMFLDHPIFGAGGGNFRHYFSHYMNEKFRSRIQQLNYEAVQVRMREKEDQSINFYARVLGEFGLVGTIIFIVFLCRLTGALRKADFDDRRTKRYLYLWLIICLTSLLQFDSLAYVNFWLLSAFILSLSSSKKMAIL